MTVRLGLIGAGGIGGVHLQAARQGDLEVTCIADIDLNAAKRRADKFGVGDIVDDGEKLIARNDVDAVIVAVPNKFHAPLTLAALAAGKDVFVEKPMALTAAECDQMNAAAAKHGRILQVGFVHRYTAVARVARELITAGRLGDIYHVKASMYRRRGIPGLGGWFTTKALSGGGPLIDLGVHIVDLALHVAGYPAVERVSGKTYSHFGGRMENYVFEDMWAGPPKLDGTFDVDDAAHALVRLAGGATLEINTTWAGNFPEGELPNMVALLGDKGGITFELNSGKLTLATEDGGRNVDINPKFAFTPGWDEPFKTQLQTFVDHVQTRTAPRASGAAGRTVCAIIDAIYESSDTNREVEVK